MRGRLKKIGKKFRKIKKKEKKTPGKGETGRAYTCHSQVESWVRIMFYRERLVDNRAMHRVLYI